MTLTIPKKTPPPFGRADCFFIGGEWVKPSSGSVIDVIAPTTEEVYMRVAEAQEADVNRAVAAARGAFDTGPWPRMSHAERANYLRAIGKKLNERVSDISMAWPNEMGILYSTAQAFAGGVGGVYDYYASLADSFSFEE